MVHEVQWSAWLLSVRCSQVHGVVTMPGAQSDGAWRDGGQGAASSYSQYGAGVSSVAGTVLNLFLFIEHRAVLLYCAKYFICKMYT